MNFNNPYSREAYKEFFQNQFLTDDFKISEEKLSFEFTPQYLKSAFVIGEDKSLELKVLEVLHDSENDPRVGLSKDIFRLMLSYGYRRALVLLHSSRSKNYRLSLATIELSLEGSKVKKEYSNPRRYSFFLGPDAKIKTPYNFLISKGRVKDFEDLLSRFSVEVVTKQFYQEIANWYFWAMDKVEYPDDVEKDKEQRNAKNLIRLITRLIFIWFMKEKNLVPKTLFEKSFVDKILNYKDKTGSTYYKAILQNLFFATLNTPMKKDDPNSRIFVEEAEKRGYLSDAHLEQGYYRYSRFIKDRELFLKQFENVPFLNGGLFESLDKGKNLRVDCFSDNPKNEERLKVPDELFFLDKEIEVDISKYVENGKNKKVTGLLEILNRYNFTIDENTPIDQDIALDPELLGKVFENLLASFNPETATTARKATGSYYTPREIVDYMVEESLIEYCKRIVLDSFMSGEEYLRSEDVITRSGDASVALRSGDASVTLRSEDASVTLQSEDVLLTFFSPYSETEIYFGKHSKLPHMLQPNVWYFVTFRLADSLPQEKLQQLEEERNEWEKKYGANTENLSDELKKEYYRLFSERVEVWLGEGYGSCILKDEKVAKIVANSIMHFNKVRYDLDDWVIMPNHVHLLIKPYPDFKLPEVMHSIKSYSAHQINKLLGKKGDVWMHESYDHIVRNEKSFFVIKNYIRQNPVKANIALPKICCSWKVTELSRFANNSTEPSRFESRSEDASITLRSQEASFTLKLRQLFDYSNDENPFKDEPEIILKLIDAIEQIKIIDPACGSGAFPMGILHKLVLALHKLDPENKLWKERLLKRVPAEIREETEKSLQNKSIDYIRKLGLIEHCIYGVDIQEIAIQISKLRFFISLLVEQQIDDTKPNRDIRALPNLETKFVAANTLIGLNKPAQMGLVSKDVEVYEKELFKIREELFYTNSRKEKLALQKKEKQIREKLYKALLESRFPNDVAEKITNWDPFDQNTHADWFDAEFMFGVAESSRFGSKGFDIVIGNPPYIQLQKAYNNKIKYADLYKDQNYKTFDRTGDIYCLFYEKGIQLLKQNGLLTYITSNKWMRAGYGEKLREFFTKHNPLQLVDLGPGVFENATVDTNILLIRKRESSLSRSGDASATLAVTLQKEDKEDIAKALNEKGVLLTKLTKDAWFIGSDAEQKLKEKIERIGKPLKDWDVKIYRGVLTGLNEAFIITTEKRNEILANCSVAESSRFAGKTERERTEEIIKPILRGRDIKRYHYEWAGLWVIFIPWHFPLHEDLSIQGASEKAEKEFQKQFPSVYQHLLQFKDYLSKRNKDETGIRYEWYALQRCAATYYPEFEKEKVVWGNISYNSQFAYVEGSIFINAPANLIISDTVSIKFLVGVMNSKIFNREFKRVGIFLGNAYEWKKQYVEQVKIPPITPSNEPIVKQIELLVDKILAANASTSSSQASKPDTSHWEREIDELVYKLYQLTPEEIKIIEGEK